MNPWFAGKQWLSKCVSCKRRLLTKFGKIFLRLRKLLFGNGNQSRVGVLRKSVGNNAGCSHSGKTPRAANKDDFFNVIWQQFVFFQKRRELEQQIKTGDFVHWIRSDIFFI